MTVPTIQINMWQWLHRWTVTVDGVNFGPPLPRDEAERLAADLRALLGRMNREAGR